MKKTTYILLAIVVFAVIVSTITVPLAALILPYSEAKDRYRPTLEGKEATMDLTAKPQAFAFDSISTLVLQSSWKTYKTIDEPDTLYFDIVEDPTLTKPVVTFGPDWRNNVTLTYQDGILKICVEFTGVREKNENAFIIYTKDNNKVAQIRIPKGMLRHVNNDYDVQINLREFENATLTIKKFSDLIDISDSSFKSLSTDTPYTEVEAEEDTATDPSTYYGTPVPVD